jgi:hypothetical protein
VYSPNLVTLIRASFLLNFLDLIVRLRKIQLQRQSWSR